MNQEKINRTAKAINAARYPEEGLKVGELIEALAVAFSGQADVHGLFIIEEAAKRAEIIKSQARRGEELSETLERCGISQGA